MKSTFKKVLMSLMILIYIGINAQETPKDSLKVKDITNLKVSETERIIDKYGGKIADSFNNAVESITPVAEEGFKIAVKLQLAKGIANLIPFLLFLLFLYLFKKEYNKINEILISDNCPSRYNKHYGPFDDDNISVQLVLYLALIILTLIIGSFTIYTGITHIIAPEWFAIKEILTLIK